METILANRLLVLGLIFLLTGSVLFIIAWFLNENQAEAKTEKEVTLPENEELTVAPPENISVSVMSFKESKEYYSPLNLSSQDSEPELPPENREP